MPTDLDQATHNVTPLRIRNGRLLDSEGRAIVLHGVNVGYKRYPYLPHDGGGVRTSFTEREAKQLAEWGMNTVRLCLCWAGLEPARGEIDTSYVQRVREIVARCGRAGLWVLVDMHQDEFAEALGGNGAPDWTAEPDAANHRVSIGHPHDYWQPAVGRAFTRFWNNEGGLRSRFAEVFATLARALRDEPAVLGYDLFNEPSLDLTRPRFRLTPPRTAAGRLLQPFYDEVIERIRQADPHHPVFYEDFFQTAWGYVPYGVGEPPNPPFRHENLGLSFHTYCPHPLKLHIPGDRLEEQAVARALDNAERNSAWPLLSEFGATDDLDVLRRMTHLADRHRLSWQYWSLKTYDDPHPGFGLAPLVANNDSWSVIDKQGRVKTDKLRVLARAYPERIAGADPQWRFDPKDGSFRFSYRPTGRGLTVVRLPDGVHYPNGRRTETTGCRIVSDADGRLVLAGTDDPARLDVTAR